MRASGPATRLENVRWIGGASCAGKTTVAQRLATMHGLIGYSSDDSLADHARRATPEREPLLHDFMAMDMDMRWVHRSPREMLETFHAFRGEMFEMIVDDLVELSARAPVLAEGFRLLPRLVAPLLAARDHAVWLVPTPEFRRAALESRGSLWDIAGRTSDPPTALENLLARDELFGVRVRSEATALSLQVIEVEVGTTIDELTALVGAALGRPARL